MLLARKHVYQHEENDLAINMRPSTQHCCKILKRLVARVLRSTKQVYTSAFGFKSLGMHFPKIVMRKILGQLVHFHPVSLFVYGQYPFNPFPPFQIAKSLGTHDNSSVKGSKPVVPNRGFPDPKGSKQDFCGYDMRFSRVRVCTLLDARTEIYDRQISVLASRQG